MRLSFLFRKKLIQGKFLPKKKKKQKKKKKKQTPSSPEDTEGKNKTRIARTILCLCLRVRLPVSPGHLLVYNYSFAIAGFSIKIKNDKYKCWIVVRYLKNGKPDKFEA